MQPKPQLQLFHSKLPANLFFLVLKDPAKGNEALLESLLQQIHCNKKGLDLFNPYRLHQLQLLPLAHCRKRKRRCQLPQCKNPLRNGCGAHPKSTEVIAPCCSNTSAIGEYPLLVSFFKLFFFSSEKLFLHLVLNF